MAEIILPPEENEETPQVPELNIDKPTENSKVITVEFEAKKTNKVSTKDTNQQLYTTDTDAWFEFKETSLEGANGTYSVVFRNRHDGSIFQRTGDVVNGVAYYKIPHQEIRHAGAWRGQLVYTLSNGDTTAREFDYDVKGHILDGKDVREIVVEDFETLMAQLRSMKDNAEQELADLVNTAERNELERQQFYESLVEDINDLQENYQELLDTGVLQTNINEKLEALEEEYAPKLTEVTAQLAQTVKQGQNESITKAMLSQEIKNDLNNGEIDFRLNTSEIENGAITIEKTNFIHKSSNLFDRNNLIQGQRLNLSTGELEPHNDFLTSDFIKVEPNQPYFVNGIVRLVHYDENGERIRAFEPNAKEYIIPSITASFFRVSTRLQYLDASQISKTVSDATGNRLAEPNEVVAYEPHLIYLSDKISISKDNIYDFPEDEPEDLELTLPKMNRNSTFYTTELVDGGFPTTSEGVIDLFDEFVDGVYVTKKTEGIDDFGNNVFSYSAKKPNFNNDFNLKHLKIGILTGLHGNERSTVVGLYHFLKDLFNNSQDNHMFNSIQSLVDIHFIPLANPSGWNLGRRNNGNGVNLNRNFTTNFEITGDVDKGESPASEPETKIIEAWLEENDFDYFVDIHNTVGVDDPWFAADHNTEEGMELIKDYYKSHSLLVDWWGDREDINFPQNTTIGRVDPYNSKSAQSWIHANAIGINGFLLELASRYSPDTRNYGSITNTFSTETIGNTIVQLMKRKGVI